MKLLRDEPKNLTAEEVVGAMNKVHLHAFTTRPHHTTKRIFLRMQFMLLIFIVSLIKNKIQVKISEAVEKMIEKLTLI